MRQPLKRRALGMPTARRHLGRRRNGTPLRGLGKRLGGKLGDRLGENIRVFVKSRLTKIRMRFLDKSGRTVPVAHSSGMIWQRLLYHRTIFKPFTPRRPGLAGINGIWLRSLWQAPGVRRIPSPASKRHKTESYFEFAADPDRGDGHCDNRWNRFCPPSEPAPRGGASQGRTIR